MDATFNPTIVALTAVLEDAARIRKVGIHNIKVRRVRARLWADTCLGVSRSKEVCAIAQIPGFVIDLDGGFRYHTDELGEIRRVRKPAAATAVRVRFERDGGLDQEHDKFKADSDTLSIDAEDDLRQLVDDTDFFNMDSGLPGIAADGYTYTIWIAIGRRSHVIMFGDSDELPGPRIEPLLEWLNERLPERHRGSVVQTSVL